MIEIILINIVSDFQKVLYLYIYLLQNTTHFVDPYTDISE